MTNSLHEKLRLAVARKGSQKAVALTLGISDAEMSRILNGERGLNLDGWSRLFEYLGLTLAESENEDDKELIRLLSKKLSEEMLVKGKT